MNTSPVIVLIDPNIMVKTRIHELLVGEAVEIVDLTSPMALLSFMSEREYKINLIITDIEIESSAEFSGVDILSLIRNKSSHIPVMILSSTSKKETITHCILSGATEYILKPFEDSFLKSKILKYMDLEVLRDESILKFNLRDYLNSEIYKASKGRYSFTLLKADFVPMLVGDMSPKDSHFYRHTDSLYSTIKSLFWDGDIYIQYGFQSQLGFFPFSDSTSILKVKEKIDRKYMEYKSINQDISGYEIKYTYSCYPDDGDSAADLLRVISSRDESHTIQ